MQTLQTKSPLNSLRLQQDCRRFSISGIEVPLRNKEFNLLAYFIENIGKIVTRSQIFEDVWDRNICCSTNTVEVHVSSLRRKLRNYFGREFIRTVNCVGYIFEIF